MNTNIVGQLDDNLAKRLFIKRYTQRWWRNACSVGRKNEEGFYEFVIKTVLETDGSFELKNCVFCDVFGCMMVWDKYC